MARANKRIIMTKWTVTVEENPENPDEVILPLPQDLIDLQGWKEGDTLEWIDNNDGSWSLQKVKDSV